MKVHIIWHVCCLECYSELPSIIQMLHGVFLHGGGTGGFRGKSMKKFWIRSAGRNLLSHDNGYIRVASLQGGKDLCYWTRPPSEFLFFSIFCGS